jgi:hypothetical protein
VGLADVSRCSTVILRDALVCSTDLVTGNHTHLISRKRIDVKRLANGVAVAYVARVDRVPIETS